MISKADAQDLERELGEARILIRSLRSQLDLAVRDARDAGRIADAAVAARKRSDAQLMAIRASQSWRVTRPLRAVKRRLFE